ncbi:MAG: hypothetical protein A2X12_07910 [Bacteroidetes bacterium GWE2_29_8]|nr:MAG: hypothetical protein A2X12_07910 [Bacteroidetes bacterium GWE2_29_8]OFY16483.1 MAG: hypothetical protein A2X02_10085 [Bacteroidetes bacterium GWF2_29_10]
MIKFTKQDALDYHSKYPAGKLEIKPTKPYATQMDLTLAYTPGVAEPCLEIKNNVEDVYKYTSKGNLVAVITNGTAVLGLGNIGPEASKPVMEGKSLLFKVFADIDSYDIELATEDIDKFVEAVKLMAPTFGGINLEDIKAPECFEIERRLKEMLNIPVMHDDQHGTAIISGGALLNALEITGKNIKDIKLVVSGSGAAGMSCTDFYVKLGVSIENIVMLDINGALTKERTDLNKYQQKYATTRNVKTLAEAMVGADVFLGVSAANIVTKEMIKSMAPNPIVFAMANPNPEISYKDAVESRDDIIMATGRSDNPNQVNNVLGFPFIFRGALDVRATTINEEMKLAAAYALAELAKEPVPEYVLEAYNIHELSFGKNYIIPKPVDKRLISYVSSAVAKAAIESGVATLKIDNWDAYKDSLNKRIERK